MKLSIYNLVILITSLFIINACSSNTTPTAKQILKNEKEQEKAAIDKTECTIDNAPKWYLSPPDGANVVAYYPAFAEKNTIERHAAWMEVASSEMDIQSVIRNNKHQELVKILDSIAVPKILDPLSATLFRDSKTTLISDMLVKIDRTSMESGLEVRSPFLDHRVVGLAMNIEGSQKVGWGKGKKVLREIFKDRLPEKIFSAPKKGFEVPLNNWLSGPLNKELTCALSPEFLSYNNLNPKLGIILKKGILQGKLSHAELGWTLMSIYSWQKERGFL